MTDFGGFKLDPSRMPSFEDTATKKRGPVTGGFIAGLHDLGGYAGRVAQGAGQVLGLPGVEDFGRGVAQGQEGASDAIRPDLNTPPWRDGGAAVAPWLEFQVARQLPLLATYVLAGKGLHKAGIEPPKSLSRLGAQLPRALGGGGGLEAGAGFANRTALSAGQGFARTALGAEVAGIPVAFGSMLQEADSKPGGATHDDTIKAAALSPVYAALDALEPAQLHGLLARGQTGNIVKRVLAAGLTGAAAEVPQEGIQTAMEQSFRPDLSARDKFTNIVDAAVTGGAIGGALGGVGGIRKLKTVNPSEISTDHLANIVDSATAPAAAPLGLPAPNIFTDAAGRSAYGETGADALRARPLEPTVDEPVDIAQAAPSLFGPESVADRGTVPSSTMVAGRNRDQGRFAPGQSIVEQPPVVPDDTSRSFRNFTTSELFAASNALANRQEAGGLSAHQREISRQIADELRYRQDTESNGSVNTEAAEAAQRELDVSSGGAGQVSSAPVSANTDFATRLNELKKGARNQWVVKLEAADESDLIDKVHKRIFEDQDASKGTITLAQRLGLLDDQLNPTQLATEIESRKAGQASTAAALAATTVPAAPASAKGGDQSFKARWKELTRGSRDPALRALKPVDEADAQRKVYEALGDKGVQSDVDSTRSLEVVAQDLGVLDENKQLTPLAVMLAKKDPIATAEAVKAGVAQGFKGAAASNFDKGAQAYLTDAAPPKFDKFEHMAAFQSGKAWAEERNAVPKVATNYWTEGVLRSQQGGEATAAVQKVQVPAEQRAMQYLNQAVDAQYDPATHPTENAQLKRMVSEGATPADLDEAQRYFSSGRGALVQAQPERTPYKGEVVTRGAPRRPVAAFDVGQTKGERVAKDQQSIQHYLLRQEIQGAFESNDITSKERIGLVHLLMRGNMQGVVDRLPGGKLRDEMKVSRRDFLAGVAATAVSSVVVPKTALAEPLRSAPTAQLRQMLARGDIVGSLRTIRDTTKNSIYRTIASKLLRSDWSNVTLSAFDQGRTDVAGLTDMSDDGVTSVSLYGAEGQTPETVLHELIHAFVQQRWAGIGKYIPENKALLGDSIDRSDAVVTKFNNLWDQIGVALQKTNPGLIENEVWANQVASKPDEMMSWVLTNPSAQAYMKSIDVNGEKITTEPSLWDKIVNFFADLFGLPHNAKVRSAFDEILNAGYSVLDAGAGVRTGDFNVKFAKALATQNALPMAKGPPQNAFELNKRVTDTMRSAVKSADEVIHSDGKVGVVRRATLAWASRHDVVKFWGKWFDPHTESKFGANGLVGLENADNLHRSIAARLAQPTTNVDDALNRLKRTDPQSYKAMMTIKRAGEFGIDPTKPFNEQTAAVREDPTLKAVHSKFFDAYRRLAQKGHVDIYNDARNVNDMQMFASFSEELYQQAINDEGLRAAMGAAFDPAQSPVEQFMHASATANVETPAGMRKWFSDHLTAQMAQADNYIRTRDDAAKASNPKVDPDEELKALKRWTKDTKAALQHMAEVPYFHFGRFGDYFVTWKVKDQATLGAISDLLLDKNLGTVISKDSLKNSVYIRLDNQTQQGELARAIDSFVKRGLVTELRSGKREVVDEQRTSGADQWFTKMIQGINDNDQLDAGAKAAAIRLLNAQYLDLTPENSTARVLTKRRNIPGFSEDMQRSFVYRNKIGADALAGLVSSRRITQALANMSQATREAQVQPLESVPQSQRNGMTEIKGEMIKRLNDRAAQREQGNIIKWLNAASSTYFLGFSVSFGVVQFTQLGATTLPELGSKYGFVKAAKEMASATPTALRIMRKVFEVGKEVSLSRAMDAVLTREVLNRAGVKGPLAEFLIRVANDGQLDFGGQVRELVRGAEGRTDSKVDKFARFGSSIGYYSETATRLIAAIATYKLNPGASVEEAAEKASSVLAESLWDYSSRNTGRMFGSNGFAGPVTPLMTKFMQYTAQLNGKLFREFYDAFKGETETERKEARKFIRIHLSAMTTLAGTLGLPLVTAFAAAFDRLKDLFDDDDEPSDIRSSYRQWLSEVLGKEIEPVLTRGVSRAAGVDLSQRIGEQDIAPFSRFMADRRNIKDSLADLQSRSWGAPSNMVINVGQGLEKMADGDMMGGMVQMLPNAFSGPVKAYQMSTKGFVDRNGNTLPLEPSAHDELVQLLGFTPAQSADYSERRNAEKVATGALNREGTMLRDKMVNALTAHDSDRVHELASEITKFDAANPGRPSVLESIEASYRRRATLQARAAATGQPLGVKPGAGHYSYGNITFAPQQGSQ